MSFQGPKNRGKSVFLGAGKRQKVREILYRPAIYTYLTIVRQPQWNKTLMEYDLKER